jgi:hypothetical protein
MFHGFHHFETSQFSCDFNVTMASVIHRNFQLLRVLGSTLRLKARVDSHSRGQKDFICREEKRKTAWGNAVGPRNRWSRGSGWKLGFIAFFVLPEGRDVSQVQTDVSWEEVSPWPIITFWDLLQ